MRLSIRLGMYNMSFIEEEYYSDDEFWDSARNEDRKVILSCHQTRTQTDTEAYDPQEHKEVLKYLECQHMVDERFDRAYACWCIIQDTCHRKSLALFDDIEFYHFMKRVFPLEK